MTSKPTRSRRLACIAAAVSALGLLAVSPASAQSTKSKVSAQERKIAQLKSRAGKIAAAYAKAEHELEETRGKIVRTSFEVKRTESDMAALRKKLRARVRAAYRLGGVGFFQFLLEARSFRDFNVRLMSLQRQTLNDEGLILQLRRKQHELEVHKAALRQQEGVFSSQKSAIAAQAHRITITLQEQNRIYQALRTQLNREELAKLFRVIHGSVRGMSVPMDFCPVDGPHAVSNDYGAPRGGGTRRHQGNDIMGPYGTPLVAAVAGRVTRTGNGGLGGTTLYLYGAGTEFYYAHLSKLSVGSGQTVSAGQTVGALGDSGNARGGAPHLHFEIHPGGGRAIDPYPSLSRVC